MTKLEKIQEAIYQACPGMYFGAKEVTNKKIRHSFHRPIQLQHILRAIHIALPRDIVLELGHHNTGFLLIGDYRKSIIWAYYDLTKSLEDQEPEVHNFLFDLFFPSPLQNQ